MFIILLVRNTDPSLVPRSPLLFLCTCMRSDHIQKRTMPGPKWPKKKPLLRGTPYVAPVT